MPRDIPADLLARVGVRLFPRGRPSRPRDHAGDGPRAGHAGDSIALDLEVEATGGAAATASRSRRCSAGSGLGDRRLALRNGSARGRLTVSSAAVGPGDHLSRVTLPHGGGMATLSRAPTPGCISSRWRRRRASCSSRRPGTGTAGFSIAPCARWPSSRSAGSSGWTRSAGARWRIFRWCRRRPVRQAARRADLLIPMGRRRRGRGRLDRAWRLALGQRARIRPRSRVTGTSGPVTRRPSRARSWAQPVDSFPPAIQITPLQPQSGDWVALSAQLGRRGAPRPAVFGGEAGRTRRVTVAVDGLWRWAFRGGSSEQSYRTWVAATASWLLGAADSARGSARPLRAVVENGRPLTFEWTAPGPPTRRRRGLERCGRAGCRYPSVRRQRTGHRLASPGRVPLPVVGRRRRNGRR